MLAKHIFLLLLLETVFVHSLVRIFPSNGSATEYGSISFFQQVSPKFDIRGIPVEMVLAPKKGSDTCAFPRNLTAFANSEEENTVVYLDYSGSECYFRCFSEAVQYYQGFVTYLTENGYPQPNTFVLVRKMLGKGDPGDPFYDTPSTTLSISDAAPPLSINFQIVDMMDPSPVLQQLRDPDTIAVQVIPEPGRWNEYYLSTSFKVSKGINVTILLIFLIISFYNMYVAYLDKVIQFDLRNAIFVFALIVAILSIVVMCSRPFSLITNFISDFQLVFIVGALYMMLYLWSICLVDFYSRNQIIALRVFIIFNLVVLLVSKTIDFILHFVDNPRLNSTRDFIASYMVVSLQLMSAVVYLFFGLYFKRRGQVSNVDIPESTLYTLKVITWLAYVGFFSNLLISMFNTSFFREAIHYAKWSYTKALLYNFIGVIRCITFLLIITARGKPRTIRDPTELEKRVTKVKQQVSHLFSRAINPIKNAFVKPAKEEV